MFGSLRSFTRRVAAAAGPLRVTAASAARVTTARLPSALLRRASTLSRAIKPTPRTRAFSAALAIAVAPSVALAAAATTTATATAAAQAPLAPLPWSYDDANPPVGAVLPDDPRVPLVKDAQGNPVLPHAFRPLKVRGVTFKNRFAVSPMCMYSSPSDGPFAGQLTDWHIQHYGKFAALGAGLVMVEATAVQPNGRISPYDSGLWDDAQVAPLKRLSDLIHSQDSRTGIQLAHAGRKSSELPLFRLQPGGPIVVPAKDGGWPDQVMGPSPLPFDTKYLTPREMTVADIRKVVDDFVSAAKRADAAGVDVVEVHGAHGYLLSTFASPLSNHRTDAYGGSFENRTRLMVEVTSAVRAVWPAHKPLFVRLSCTDWAGPGGWDLAQTQQLVPRLLAAGADVIDCSSGGISSQQKIVAGPLYQTVFSSAIRTANPGSLTAAVGEITTPAQCEEVLETGKADFVFLGRQLLREPSFVMRAAKELKAPIAWAPQYLRQRL